VAKARSTPHARPAATTTTVDQPRTRHAALRTSDATGTKKSAVSATAAISRVKPLLLPKTPAAPASAAAGGGRADALREPHPGVGFATPSGRFSISPAGFQLGGSQHPIASASGVLAAALVTLAALAAFAAVSGGVALLRTILRNRRASRRRSTVTSAKSRTRQQLYSEARRQNIRGRSNMSKAQLEHALSHQGASR
jgi:hypothetical protein